MRKILVGLAVVAGAFSLTACEYTPACSGLTASAADKSAAAAGYEVEVTDSQGYDCELSRDGRSWQVDD